MTAIIMDKAALRRECLARRAAIAAATREKAATALANIGISFLEYTQPVIASGYYPIGDELDCLPLLRRLIEARHRIGLPVTKKGEPLKFREWTPETRMEAGAMGIKTPPKGSPEITPVVLLVPLAAFDERGYRIGYGGGFYDRTLAKLRAAGPVTAVGVAFVEQRIDRVLNEPHDEPLDWVLTPDGAFRVGGA